MKWARENAFDAQVAQAASTYGVAVPLIKAVIAVESGFNPNAYRAEAPRPSLPPTADFPNGGDASLGLMQLLVRTARTLGYNGPMNGLYDPGINIGLGTRLLRDNLKRTGGNVSDAISAYNGGFRPALGFGSPLSTGLYGNQAHVSKVLAALAYFEGEGGSAGTSPATFPDAGRDGNAGDVAQAAPSLIPVLAPPRWYERLLWWIVLRLRGQ